MLANKCKSRKRNIDYVLLQPFELEKELNAIPALSLEEFQQKVLNSRQQQQGHHGRSNSLSPTQNPSAASVASVSLTPTSIVSTNHVGVQQASGVSISQGSVAIVNNQSTANISYHPQVCLKNAFIITTFCLFISIYSSPKLYD